MSKSESPRRGVSIRWSLLRSFLLLILILAGPVYVLVSTRGARIARELAETAVRRTVDRMESELAHFFEPVSATLEFANGWARAGVLRCGSVACINDHFGPVMQRHPQIDSVNTGDEAGRGVMLLRAPTGWRNRIVDVEAQGGLARFIDYDGAFAETSRSEEEVGYDPRQRAWYAAARDGAPGRIHWTEPYAFFTSGQPGMTGAVRVHPPESDAFVLALDVRLDAITRFARSLDTGPHGLVFVLDGPTGRILGVPRHPALETDAAVKGATLGLVRDLDIPVLHAASREAMRRESEHAGSAIPPPFPFEFEHERWWVAVRSFERPGAPQLLLGVIAPERDFLGDLSALRWQLGGLTFLAGVAAAFVAGWLARKYTRPVRDLVDKSERIRRLDLARQPPARTRVAELQHLDRAQEDMRNALDAFARYVPTDVVRDLLARGEAAKIGGTERPLTVLFTDIAGFTSISEGMTPTALTEHMSEYFEAMVTTLRDAGATVDKLVGDAIVAFWGAPTPDEAHAAHAVEGVLRCRERLDVLNRAWCAQGKPALPTRFGLATGPVVVGNIGAPTRLHYTGLGDTMNLASRLEAASGRYGATSLVARATVEEAGNAFVFRAVDRLAVKGKIRAVDVFEILGRRGEVPEDDPRKVRLEGALERYRARAFAEALRILEPLGSDDAVAAALADRCQAGIEHPPAEDWDGTTRLDVK